MSFKIAGTGRGIPKKVVTNDDLSRFLDTDDEWITTRTGIKTRHVCTDESLTDLSQMAAQRAIGNAGLESKDIDLIICSTINGDYVTPSLACVVQERIGASCPAFDVNAACSGFIYALDIAALYLDQNKAKNVLIVCAEMMSRHIDWTDRRVCVLFGDGAGACVLSKGTALKYIKLVAEGDNKPIYLESGTGNSPFVENKNSGFMQMMGNDVYKFAVGMVEREVTAALSALEMSPDDIDYFVLHQANKRIIDTARAKLKQPAKKFPINIQNYGNISSATIPILLDEMTEQGRIKAGDTLFLNAFGAGMTAGSCVLVWE